MNDLLRRVLFLPEQASTVASDIDGLHAFVITVTMLGAAAVAGLAATFMIRYRRPASPVALAEVRHGKAPVSTELLLIGGLFVLFVTWWFIGMRQYVALRTAPAGTVDVYVFAKQWMWKFAYPQGPESIATLYVPAGQPVRLIMTSRDVIHSFFVPDFRVKQDVLPGRTTTVWFEAMRPGRHQILCTEFCGTGHSTMRGEVVVLGAADYEEFLQGHPRPRIAGERYEPPGVVLEYSPSEPLRLVDHGMRIAGERGCLRCHTTDGTPHIGPSFGRMFGARVRLEDGSTVRIDEAYVTESMMDPMAKVRSGFPRMMPSYLGWIDPGETAAIIELIRSLSDAPARQVPPADEGMAPVEARPRGEEP